MQSAQVTACSVLVVFSALLFIRRDMPSMASRLRNYWRLNKAANADPVLAATREIVRETEVERLHHALLIVRFGYVFTTIVNVYNTLLQSTWRRWMSPEQDAIFTFLFGFNLFFGMLPRSKLARCAGFVQAVNLLACALLVTWSQSTLFHLICSVGMQIGPRALFTVGYRRPIIGIGGNLLCSAAWSYHVLRFEDPTLVLDSRYLVIVEWGISALLTVMSVSANMLSWNAAALLVETRSLQVEAGAMGELMSLACDVCVELTDDRKICGSVPKLTALLNTGSSANLSGRRLEEFMGSDEDRNKFNDLLQASLTVPGEAHSCAHAVIGMPGAMHVRFRGCWDTLLCAELFYVSMQRLTGRRWMVGIREFSDIEAPLLLKASGHMADLPLSSAKSPPPPRQDTSTPAPTPTAEEEFSQMLASHPLSEQGSSNATPPRTHRGREPAAVDRRSCVVRGCLETEQAARDGTLVEVMERWNVQLDPSYQCCAYHSMMWQLMASARRLRRTRCQPLFRPVAHSQCTTCGLFGQIDAIALGGACGPGGQGEDEMSEPSAVAYCDHCGTPTMEVVVPRARDDMASPWTAVTAASPAAAVDPPPSTYGAPAIGFADAIAASDSLLVTPNGADVQGLLPHEGSQQ